jgi:hypothetical protein
MTDREIDALLAGKNPDQVDPALAEKISGSVLGDLRPVRPLAPKWSFTLTLLVATVAVAVATAWKLHMSGFERMTGVEAAAIFGVLGVLMALGGLWNASTMVPGSRFSLSPRAAASIGTLALLGLFALVFHDYSATNFLKAGIICLKAGLADAIPAALLVWLVVRRGYAVDRVKAGAAAGALAGLAGVMMLEIHCPLFEAPHILVWHVAVLPIASLAGALVGWLSQRFGVKRKDAELMQ